MALELRIGREIRRRASDRRVQLVFLPTPPCYSEACYLAAVRSIARVRKTLCWICIGLLISVFVDDDVDDSFDFYHLLGRVGL